MRIRDFYLESDPDEIGSRRSKTFNLIARPIVVLYGACFESDRAYDSWRYAVFTTKKKSEHRRMTTPADVATIRWYVDYAKFFACSESKQRETVLRALHGGVRAIARQKSISTRPFDDAHRRVRSVGLRAERECLRKLGPAHGRSAVLVGSYQGSQFVAYLLVHNREGYVIGRKLAFRALADEVYFQNKMGSLRWESVDVVSLLSVEERLIARMKL